MHFGRSASPHRGSLSSGNTCVGQNAWHRPALLELTTDRIGVIALVGMQDVAVWKAFDQRRASGAIRDLAAGEHEGERTALSVGQRVDFYRAPAARAADCLGLLPGNWIVLR